VDLADRHYEWEWSYLNNNSEVARYGVVAGYICRYLDSGTLLDLGCGEAILCKYLVPRSVKQYVGIDCSDVVFSLEHLPIPSLLSRARIETYCPEVSFNAIVFNEVLYYLTDPRATLTRYARYLSSDGILVISMYDNRRSVELTNKVAEAWASTADPEFETVDQAEITNVVQDLTWRTRVLRPRR
jgi:2-polyprenyl-6-hydroxyphenyl methylase/3-demethylubiquinone-9 3-methyltransferase